LRYSTMGDGERERSSMTKIQWYMAATYIGAIVGAGFASGQETLTFFVTYGISGLLGILAVTAGFALMGALNFGLAQARGIDSYKQLLETISGHRWAVYYDVIITCFLLAGVGVMLAGAGSLVHQQWAQPPLLGVLITALIAGLSCYRGIDGIFRLNGLLVPGILLLTAVLGFSGFRRLVPWAWERGNEVFWAVSPSPLVPNWWLAAIIYLSYNSMLGIAACIPLAGSIPRRRTAILGGIMGGLALGFLLFSGSMAIWGMGPKTTQSPVPMAWIATYTHPVAGNLYGIIIWSAMLTTAATNLFAVIKRLRQRPGIGILSILLGLAFILSLMGFSALIELLYPVFGYIGCLYVIQTLVFFWRQWGSQITTRWRRM
jgi:uncharacterized membrane protein YkvI